jgi:hypothetical protein
MLYVADVPNPTPALPILACRSLPPVQSLPAQITQNQKLDSILEIYGQS